MNTEYTRQNNSQFRDFEEAAVRVLQIMAAFVDINTLFIARNDGKTNRMVKVLNKENTLVSEGEELPFHESYCSLSVQNGERVLIIPDVTLDKQTSSMKVTENLGGGTFIAIPINYEDGENYGTICGLDTKNRTFSDEQVKLFETMSSLLTYVLELDYTHQQLYKTAAPVVPITSGVAILPVVGDIDERRAESIIETALFKSQELGLDHLVIDLSGVMYINETVVASLLKIAAILKLIGVTPILTGFRPDLAMKTVQMNAELNDILIVTTLEQALNQIGFELKK
ncbi:GAF domain-containing protein [Domibacillus sp. A3M-37]|uniref:STAS domain-containing protein n=1 Tax=Domibacillus TaxID=1433999 RepID=UPI000617C5B7|nr:MULTISPECIES: STAS domain-containing protein [Domibacillus]MCP3762766.1 GAF domain-containing protein [Domibacillus sp. A3M-37]